MGQLVGLAILLLVLVGVAKTFLRKDLTWSQKIGGRSKHWPDD